MSVVRKQDAVGDWRTLGDDGLDETLRAARSLFAVHGYDGTSIRAIAGAAGKSVPGVYHHYSSKQVILDEVVSRAIGTMLAYTRAADAASDGTALGRFDHVIEALLRFHMERRDDAFVASTEMRSMEPAVLRRHVAQRDEQQAMIRGIIEQGVAASDFDCRSPGEAARAVSSLCVSVASWYRPDGLLSVDEIADRYGRFARGIVGASDPNVAS